MSVPGSSPIVLSPRDRDLVKTAMRAADIPTPSVRAASDTLEDVEPDDPPPVSRISTSFMLSSPIPTVSPGLVASLIVVPFISSPSPSPPRPPLIVLLEPGCDLREEELAEEVLTIEELQQYFPALRQDIDTLPPDIVSDTQASPSLVVATSIDAGDNAQAASVEPTPLPLSNPLLLVSEPDECVCPPSSLVTLPLLASIQEEAASSRGTPEREGVISSTEEVETDRVTRVKVEVSQEGGNEIIIISSPEQDIRDAPSDLTELRTQLSELRRQRRSDMCQLAFWAETVAKLGEEVTRPPTTSESKSRDKLVACGDWPPHMFYVRDATFREMGNRFTDIYKAVLHSLPEDK